MPDLVVELLEPVDVHHDDPERGLEAGGAMELAFQRLLEVPPIEEAGDVVAHRLLAQQDVALLELGVLAHDLLEVFAVHAAGDDAEG